MMKETKQKLTVATIGQKLIEYGCSDNQTAEYVKEQTYDIIDSISGDSSLADFISEQTYSIALLAKSEENDTIEYDEEQQLKLLAESIHSALEAENDKFEQTVDDDSDFDQGYFSIIIAGRIHRFMIGGPQTAALHKFIDHICAENLYPDIK